MSPLWCLSSLRPQCSKFHALKRIKRKEKLELLGSYAKKGKPDLSENSMLLKKVFNALNSLSMCIFSSHSSNSYLTSHETLIPNNHCVWMKKGSYSWAFSFFFGSWSNSFDCFNALSCFMHYLSYLHAFFVSCISLFALSCFDLTFMF